MPGDVTKATVATFHMDHSASAKLEGKGAPCPSCPPATPVNSRRFEHPLAARYASKAMVRLLSPLYRMRVWRRLWVALAESEAELGLPVTPGPDRGAARHPGRRGPGGHRPP